MKAAEEEVVSARGVRAASKGVSTAVAEVVAMPVPPERVAAISAAGVATTETEEATAMVEENIAEEEGITAATVAVVMDKVVGMATGMEAVAAEDTTHADSTTIRAVVVTVAGDSSKVPQLVTTNSPSWTWASISAHTSTSLTRTILQHLETWCCSQSTRSQMSSSPPLASLWPLYICIP